MRQRNPNIHFKSDAAATAKSTNELDEESLFESYQNQQNTDFDGLVHLFKRDVKHGNTLEIVLRKLLDARQSVNTRDVHDFATAQGGF